MKSSFTITSLTEAETTLQRAGPKFFQHIVSIGNPLDTNPANMPPPSLGSQQGRVLRLVFRDVKPPYKDHPTTEHIQRIIDFAPGIKESPGNILIHCNAGISRSSAAAIILLYCLLGDEQEALKAMYEARAPHSRQLLYPHEDMLLFADNIMGSSLLPTVMFGTHDNMINSIAELEDVVTKSAKADSGYVHAFRVCESLIIKP
jgi:predicted protein tyrosine phosphatase